MQLHYTHCLVPGLFKVKLSIGNTKTLPVPVRLLLVLPAGTYSLDTDNRSFTSIYNIKNSI